jgi:hypothetical protein
MTEYGELDFIRPANVNEAVTGRWTGWKWQRKSHPRADFGTRWSFLIGRIEPDGEYGELLPSFEALMIALAKSGALPDPISDFTTQFSHNLLPAVISAITVSSASPRPSSRLPGTCSFASCTH